MALDYLKSSYLKPAHETMDASDQTATRRDKGYYTKLFMLLIAFFITCIISYNLWTPKIVAKFAAFRSGLTAIIHDAEKPSAIINGQIVHVGDSVGKRKIIAIEINRVTVQKDKKTYQMQL